MPSSLYWPAAQAEALGGTAIRRNAWKYWLYWQAGLWFVYDSGVSPASRRVVTALDFGVDEFLASDWTDIVWDGGSYPPMNASSVASGALAGSAATNTAAIPASDALVLNARMGGISQIPWSGTLDVIDANSNGSLVVMLNAMNNLNPRDDADIQYSLCQFGTPTTSGGAFPKAVVRMFTNQSFTSGTIILVDGATPMSIGGSGNSSLTYLVANSTQGILQAMVGAINSSGAGYVTASGPTLVADNFYEVVITRHLDYYYTGAAISSSHPIFQVVNAAYIALANFNVTEQAQLAVNQAWVSPANTASVCCYIGGSASVSVPTVTASLPLFQRKVFVGDTGATAGISSSSSSSSGTTVATFGSSPNLLDDPSLAAFNKSQTSVGKLIGAGSNGIFIPAGWSLGATVVSAGAGPYLGSIGITAQVVDL